MVTVAEKGDVVIQPYFADNSVELYLGKTEDLLSELGSIYGRFDACITDPPYGETSLAWDRWLDGWPALVAQYADSLWCFGSMRLLATRWTEFVSAGLTYSQDVVWEKHTGSSLAADRFRRVHEHAVLWYSGSWGNVHHVTPRVRRTGKDQSTRRVSSTGEHLGKAGRNTPWCDDGTRLMRSVIWAKSLRGKALHPTEKPQDVLRPLVEYSVPPGGLVLDPFAGSASTLLAARTLGRRAIGIEANEAYCEAAAKRLSVQDLFTGGDVA